MRKQCLILAIIFALVSVGCLIDLVNAKNLTIEKEYTIRDKEGKYKDGAKFKKEKYDNKKKLFLLTLNESPKISCWRLVHDGTTAKSYSESDQVTTTAMQMFCGTKAECQAEIDRLNLDVSGIENEY